MIPSHTFPIVALILYLIAAAFSSSETKKKISFVRCVVGVAILFHAYSLIEFYSVASLHLLAFLMSAVALGFSFYFIISGGGKFKSLRQLVLGFIIVPFLGSSVLIHLGHGQNINVKSVYLLWSHVGFSLVGLLFFLASGFLGVAYLSQARALKPKKQEMLSSVIGRLPPLRDIAKLIKLTGKVGLFTTIIGLYLGFLYTESTGIQIDISDPKLLLPTILVIYYGLILVSRSKISETMFAKVSSFGIILTISSLIIASLR